MRELLHRLAAAAMASALAVSLLQPAPASADPPPWAPAHGWRAKHEHKHKHKRHDDRVVYVVPYGLGERTCYRDLLGAALDDAVIGVLIGGAIVRGMDDIDRACVAQVLEYVPDRHPVIWGEYEVVPMRTWKERGRYCREYQSRAWIGGREQMVYGRACRMPDGSWRVVS